MSMRVLHLPLETGHQVHEICRSLREAGVYAAGLNWRDTSYIGYEQRYVSPTDAFEMAGAFEELLAAFDILHYHTGYTVYPDKSDIAMALKAGKKVIMHHRGNDVRIPSVAKRLNPYVYTGDSQPESQIVASLRTFGARLPAAIVQDYELFDYVKGFYRKVHVLPRLIDTAALKPVPAKRNPAEPPLIVHAPTSRAFKGTDRIVDTVEKLRRVVPLRFMLLEHMKRAEVVEWMAKADIVIDQVLCGAYGNVSVEAMALGRPVVCYLRPDIRMRLRPDPPIVSATPDQLFEALRGLLRDEALRSRLGRLGREYVCAVHDARQVARQLIQIYRSL